MVAEGEYLIANRDLIRRTSVMGRYISDRLWMLGTYHCPWKQKGKTERQGENDTHVSDPS